MDDFSSKRAKHVIVISYDAFSEDNWDFASSLPNLSQLISKGVYSNDLISIYPSLTYVVHSTLVTGVYPDRHEIIHNNPFQPFISEKNQEWFWYRKDINVSTIYDAAKEANLTTSAILWPVTGKAKIDYNLPEVVAINGENQAFKILKNGSPFFCAKLSLKYGKVLDGVNQPNLDDFRASDSLDKLLGKHLFDHPKDVEVISKWINAVTGGKSNALVVDFFAGSGSTGHAVMELNASDGGSRRYMLVQVDETHKSQPPGGIPEVTRERLRRAGSEIESRQLSTAPCPDTGFRSYRLGLSNLRAWDGTGQLDLLGAVDNLVAGRTTDDLLVEMMLRLGVELTTSVEKREVAGAPLYCLGGGTLYAYFGEDVSTERSIEVARALVEWREENPVDSDVTIVVRDTGFTDSSAKLNLEAAIKQAGFTTFRSI